MRSLMVVMLVLFGAGCDSDCENVCEVSQDCSPLLEEFAVFIDCDATCDALANYAEDRNCGREFDVYYGCLDDSLRDECVVVASCSTEGEAYHSCIGTP